jgi:hypothetical protein
MERFATVFLVFYCGLMIWMFLRYDKHDHDR